MRIPKRLLWRSLSITMLASMLATAGWAQTTLTATLNGANERPSAGDPDGSGFAVVDIDADAGTVRYVITANDILDPTAAHIHRGTSAVAGDVVVNFAPAFIDGVATATVEADPSLLNEILADPAAFYVNVHNTEYPGGAIRGQLTAMQDEIGHGIFPVAGSGEGANNTFFRTDMSLLNMGETETTVTLEFYSAGDEGTAPSSIANIDLAAHEHIYLFEVTQDTFGLPSGTAGAIRVISPQPVTAVARIYNDARESAQGTFGQFVSAQTLENNRSSGALPMLANALPSTGMGYRTNIGWFNDGAETVTIVFRARRSDGTVIETTSQTVMPKQQRQMAISQLFPSMTPMDSLYVTFETDESVPLYVYASVVDNVNGDAVFIPAQ